MEDRAFQAEGQKAQDVREPGLSKETKPRPLGPEQSDGEGGRDEDVGGVGGDRTTRVPAGPGERFALSSR